MEISNKHHYQILTKQHPVQQPSSSSSSSLYWWGSKVHKDDVNILNKSTGHSVLYPHAVLCWQQTQTFRTDHEAQSSLTANKTRRDVAATAWRHGEPSRLLLYYRSDVFISKWLRCFECEMCCNISASRATVSFYLIIVFFPPRRVDAPWPFEQVHK